MISILLIILAAIANSCMDMNFNDYDNSIFSNTIKFNPNFWNPTISYKNKWKDGIKANGEKFLLSSTYLVFLTDSWHMFKFLFLNLIIAAIIFYQPIIHIYFKLFNFNIYYIDFIIFNCIWGIIFEITSRLLTLKGH